MYLKMLFCRIYMDLVSVCSQLNLPQLSPLTAGPGGSCSVSTPLCGARTSLTQPKDLGVITPGLEFQLYETMQSKALRK